ncbi:hypothetical protein EYV94_14620 [Puteibacter caeruleilacunae]|nr:hypothetical protein EYV94_14620 [Puteibacter caeruleilacunae]
MSISLENIDKGFVKVSTVKDLEILRSAIIESDEPFIKSFHYKTESYLDDSCVVAPGKLGNLWIQILLPEGRYFGIDLLLVETENINISLNHDIDPVIELGDCCVEFKFANSTCDPIKCREIYFRLRMHDRKK